MNSILKLAIKSLLLICISALLLSPTCQAAQREKASVAVIFNNNAKTTYDDELTTKINFWFSTKVDGVYDVHDPRLIQTHLKNLGIDDLTTVEKSQLIDACSSNNIDYLIVAELEPFIRKEKITVFTYGKDMTATMYLKIVDVPNNKYLYNGKFIIKGSDSTNEWLIGNKSVAMKAIDSVLIEMGEVISFRLPLQKPVVKENS